MITRNLDSTWAAGCAGAPPPLDVVDDNPQSRWYPLPRPYLRATPPGPALTLVASGPPVGDDPTDPSAQTERRIPTFGMIGRMDVIGRLGGSGNIGPGSVR